MAMTKCKECKAAISTKAEACPQCGAKRPKPTSGCAMIMAIAIGLVFVVMLFRGCSDDSSPSTPAITSSGAASRAPAAPVKAPPPDPVAVLAESKATLNDIQSRLKENDKSLKRYYGTTDQVKEATNDLVKLALIQVLYGKPTDNEQKAILSQANALAKAVSQQQRVLYASSAEQIFVKNGMDVKVSALGANKARLQLKYVLMSKPLVYKFQNEMKLDEQARFFSFKKIIYTDGYDSTWTVDL